MTTNPESPEEKIHRLNALALIQAADTSAVLRCILAIEKRLRPKFPQLPDMTELFLKERKVHLHAYLERYETTDPAMAARLQQTIDDSSVNYPFDYD